MGDFGVRVKIRSKEQRYPPIRPYFYSDPVYTDF